jgi:adenosine deaminase/aminodeoxyfutalosine deaminase
MPFSLDLLPKAELHLHLEGSIQPSTLRELKPSLSLEEIEARYRYSDFLGFLQSFKWVVEHLRGPDDYALTTRRLLQALAQQNVRYVEVTLSAGMVLWRKQEFSPIYDAVVQEAARQRQVDVWWVIDAVRQFGVDQAWEVARLAVDRGGDRVVAFGLGGDEARGPASLFADVLAFVRSHGLALAPHAGETTDAGSVWDAVRHGARRIGHGIRAAQDEDLMRELRDRDVALEVCVTSNVATGAVPSIEQHPLRRLWDAGVPVTLNTDDPAMFRTTIQREFEIAANQFGFSQDELERLAANGFRYAFRPVPLALEARNL